MVIWQPNESKYNKCALQVNKKDELDINLGETEIKNSEYGKLLGMKFDKKLNFNEHLNNVITKASHKVNVLLRDVPCMKSVFQGRESIQYFGPKICDIAPLELKESINLNPFKNVIKKCQPKNCACRLCKQYVSYLGFIRKTFLTFMLLLTHSSLTFRIPWKHRKLAKYSLCF